MNVTPEKLLAIFGRDALADVKGVFGIPQDIPIPGEEVRYGDFMYLVLETSPGLLGVLRALRTGPAHVGAMGKKVDLATMAVVGELVTIYDPKVAKAQLHLAMAISHDDSWMDGVRERLVKLAETRGVDLNDYSALLQ